MKEHFNMNTWLDLQEQQINRGGGEYLINAISCRGNPPPQQNTMTARVPR